MVNAILLVEGNVQGVSFRAYAKQLARKFGLKGLAKNLEDGSVRLFLDGSRENISSFVKLVSSKKGDSQNPFSLHVDNATVFFEGEKGFEKAWKKYEGFEIDYGAKLGVFEKENLERLEIGSIVLQDFRDETRGSFKTMDEKYGVIHQELNEFKKVMSELSLTLKENRDDFKRLAQAIVKLGEAVVSKKH